MAASLRKKMQLARRVGLFDEISLVEPCFTIVGHEMHTYFAYIASEEKDGVHILGPEVGSLGLCETSSGSGIFRALKLWQNVIRYGRDEGIGDSGVNLWGKCCKNLLGTLTSDIRLSWTFCDTK